MAGGPKQLFTQQGLNDKDNKKAEKPKILRERKLEALAQWHVNFISNLELCLNRSPLEEHDDKNPLPVGISQRIRERKYLNLDQFAGELATALIPDPDTNLGGDSVTFANIQQKLKDQILQTALDAGHASVDSMGVIPDIMTNNLLRMIRNKEYEILIEEDEEDFVKVTFPIWFDGRDLVIVLTRRKSPLEGYVLKTPDFNPDYLFTPTSYTGDAFIISRTIES